MIEKVVAKYTGYMSLQLFDSIICFFGGGTVIALLAILQGILFTLLCMLVMRGYCYRR